MNYLAHLYLSFDDEQLLVGNYIADAVKGRQIDQFPEGIKNGIILHRKIDEFTDSYPVVEQSKSRIRSRYRKYSGVVVDMYYDHFLARNWGNYSTVPLANFAESVYDSIEQHWDFLPEKSQYMFPYMKSGNWLMRYATTKGIEKSLTGMSRRLNNNSKLELAIDQLHEFYELFKSEFEIFIPDLNKQFEHYH